MGDGLGLWNVFSGCFIKFKYGIVTISIDDWEPSVNVIMNKRCYFRPSILNIEVWNSRLSACYRSRHNYWSEGFGCTTISIKNTAARLAFIWRDEYERR